MLERAKIQSILDRLKKNSRIDDSYCSELDKSFDNQTLYIGVVGRMKAGKSSLINAAVIGEEKLPSGVAPTTVTLTEISYSNDEDKAVVELMTRKDIEDIKTTASYSGDDIGLIRKAESAKITINSFTEDYEKYLDLPPQTIKFSELSDFVVAGGKYSGLAKNVKVYIKNDALKGITIIDTPGFNDPIPSRGETTRNALNKCHVLLFVHDKDGYHEDDLDLLTEQIEYAGISEIIDVLNKIDILDMPINEWPEELAYFNKKRANLNISKQSVKSLIENSKATYASSLMALCGLIPIDKMNEDLRRQFSSFEEDFEELSGYSTKEEQQKAFVRFSNINSIIDEINRLSKDGSVYLIDGPLLTLKGKLNSINNIIISEIEEKESKLKSLQVSIDANRATLQNFSDFMSTVLRKVSVSSLSSKLSTEIQSGLRTIQALRTNEAASQFSKEKYPEPVILGHGVTKANIANYNSFIFEFESKVRDTLNNLKDKLSSICKAEINSLLADLSNTSQIDREHIKYLEGKLKASLVSIIDDITVIVPSKRISSLPAGNQKQWDKFRAIFLNDYDDSVICDSESGLMVNFKQTIQTLAYINVASRELDDLKNEIEADLKKSPLQKQEEIKVIQSEIDGLKTEIFQIKNDIKEIDALKFNVNN